MNFTFWQIVCAILIIADATSSAVVMYKKAIWSNRTIALAILGFGAEALVLLYILGIIY